MLIVVRYIFYGYREKNGPVINTFFFFSSREKKLSNLFLKYVVRFDYQEKNHHFKNQPRDILCWSG